MKPLVPPQGLHFYDEAWICSHMLMFSQWQGLDCAVLLIWKQLEHICSVGICENQVILINNILWHKLIISRFVIAPTQKLIINSALNAVVCHLLNNWIKRAKIDLTFALLHNRKKMGSPRRIYLLVQSWPLLRLFSLAGVFPIKKVETGEKVTFVPMHVCNMLAKWMFLSIVTLTMAYAGIMYAASKMENMTPLGLFEGLFSSTNLTSTDTLTSYTSLIVYYMANVLIIWRNFVVRNILC